MNDRGKQAALPAPGRRIGRSCRFLCLGVAALMLTGGCPYLPDSAFSAFEAFVPSAEQLAAYERDLATFYERLDNLPSVAVRIVNSTDATARVVLSSGSEGPEPPMGEHGFAGPGEEFPWLVPAQSQTVLVAANGTATGTLKCGDVIGVSATAPFDPGAGDYFPQSFAFGLFIEMGNVSLTGVGTADTHDFVGDVVSAVRFVQPAEDGLDCTAGTLVITITAAATQSTYDAQTGELLTGTRLGSGTLSIE